MNCSTTNAIVDHLIAHAALGISADKFVQLNPTGIVDQVVTNSNVTELRVVNGNNSDVWLNTLVANRGCLVVANYDADYAGVEYMSSNASAETAFDGSAFRIFSQRVVGGVGGWTLNVVNSNNVVTRLDLPSTVVRQAWDTVVSGNQPTTDGTYLVWLATNSGSPATQTALDEMWVLLSGAWSFTGIAA